MCNGNPYPSKNLSMHSFSILNWNAWKFADKCPNIRWRAQVWMLVLLHFLRFLGILSNPKISDLKLIPPPPYITIPVLVTVTAGGWGRRQWVTGAVASCPIGVRCPVPVPAPAQTSRNLPDSGPASADPRTTARSWSRDPPRPRCPHQSLEVSTKFGSNFHSRYIKLHLKLGHCPQDPLQEFMKQPNSGGETMYVCLNTYWLCLLLIFPSLKVLGTFNKENAGILSEYSAKFCWHLY